MIIDVNPLFQRILLDFMVKMWYDYQNRTIMRIFKRESRSGKDKRKEEIWYIDYSFGRKTPI